MKIIDLLNKIANGEEVPKKIKYKDFIYEYYEQETIIDYRCYDEKTELYGYLSSCVDYETFNILNNEVEIIDNLEEDKKIEKLMVLRDTENHQILKDKEKVRLFDTAYYKNLTSIQDKVNELIDEVNKLKENK